MNEFPYINPNYNTDNDLPIPTEYGWDFLNNKFLFDEYGKHLIVEKNEAIKIWIYKALQTERFMWLAYSWQYGIELRQFIGKVMQVQERFSELKRVIIECLMVNPYIKSIDEIKFDTAKLNDETILVTDIKLTTIYGAVVVNV